MLDTLDCCSRSLGRGFLVQTMGMSRDRRLDHSGSVGVVRLIVSLAGQVWACPTRLVGRTIGLEPGCLGRRWVIGAGAAIQVFWWTPSQLAMAVRSGQQARAGLA